MAKTVQEMIDKVHRLSGTNTSEYSDAEQVADFNDAMRELEMEAGFSDGDAEWDDPRFDNTDGGRPNGEVDLEAGQKVYSFSEDENSNRLLSIYRIDYYDKNGGKQTLVRGEDYDLEGINLILDFEPKETRSGTEDANYLQVWFTREGLEFSTSSLTDTSPFPADFDKFLIYRNVESWCTSEAEDPSMRAKADRYERKAELIKPRFKKWLQRYLGRGSTRLKAKKNNLR